MRWSRGLIQVILLLGAFTATSGWVQQRASSIGRGLFDSANRERHQQGLPELKWDDALAGAARKHAEQMAEHGMLSHQLPGEASLAARVAQAGVHHSWLSENVAEGTSADDIHAQFMKSPNHRANILDSDMDAVGIGAVEFDGKWYAVEEFIQAK